ncbi:helix-turn-helix domain-containing protein [Myroides sp. LJL119]
MLSNKVVIIQHAFYKKALYICRWYILLLLLEVGIFGLLQNSDLYVFNGPLFFILVQSLRNRFRINRVIVHLLVGVLYLLSLLILMSNKTYLQYSTIIPATSLLCYGVSFFVLDYFKYIMSEFKFWLKYMAWFCILIGTSAFLYLINLADLHIVKVNTYFFVLGLTCFSLIYLLLLYRALRQNQNDLSYLKKVDTLKAEYRDKVQSLQFYFDTNNHFLDPDFSIDDLATPLNMDKKDLSFLLNQVLDTNFYNLLAEKRIKVAQGLIENYSDIYTIEYIMQQSGFRSKSSFNRYFKYHTNKTPSEFRDMINRSKL